MKKIRFTKSRRVGLGKGKGKGYKNIIPKRDGSGRGRRVNRGRGGCVNTKYDYEISLKWVGRGRKPAYTRTEYGFGMNPPISIRAKSKSLALKQLKIPKTVKVAKIERFSTKPFFMKRRR